MRNRPPGASTRLACGAVASASASDSVPAGRRWSRLLVTSGSARPAAESASRIHSTELSEARLRAGSSPCCSMCRWTRGSSRARSLGARSPRASRISPSVRSFRRSQSLIAAIRASREMKSICSARMPKSRLRSDATWAMSRASDSGADTRDRRRSSGAAPQGGAAILQEPEVDQLVLEAIGGVVPEGALHLGEQGLDEQASGAVEVDPDPAGVDGPAQPPRQLLGQGGGLELRVGGPQLEDVGQHRAVPARGLLEGGPGAGQELLAPALAELPVVILVPA